MKRLPIAVSAALFATVACDKPSSSQPTTSSSATTAAATSEATPTEKESAAAAFPATALPAKSVAEYTIGVPPGGKVDKVNDEKATLETADFKLMIAVAKANETAKVKEMFSKAPGFRAIIDTPDGLAMETENRGEKMFAVTRYVKLGDVVLVCDSALAKPPTSEDKAKEAWDLCGTLKKK